MALPQLRRTVFHAAQKHGRIGPAVESAPHGMATGGQVSRRTHGRNGLHNQPCLTACLLGPAQQGIATERDPRRMLSGMRQAQASQYPIYFLMVTRVIGAWPSIEFTTAPSEMRHRHMPTGGVGHVCAGADVMAL